MLLCIYPLLIALLCTLLYIIMSNRGIVYGLTIKRIKDPATLNAKAFTFRKTLKVGPAEIKHSRDRIYIKYHIRIHLSIKTREPTKYCRSILKIKNHEAMTKCVICWRFFLFRQQD
uniref:Uncharacterized protein n=1 Tax=Glossina pallidipes TaxID=7398 RepID=A0A1A9ZYL1_GLOPL